MKKYLRKEKAREKRDKLSLQQSECNVPKHARNIKRENK